MAHGVERAPDPKRKWVRWLGIIGWLLLIGGTLSYLTQGIHNPKIIQQPVISDEKSAVITTIMPSAKPSVVPSKVPAPSLFFYQVGAFSDEKGAKSVQQRLVQLGLPVRLIIGKEVKPLIRVIVGPLKPQQEEWLKTQGFQPIVWENPK